MQYRSFGDKATKVSRLGFGAMRLPHTGEGKDYRLLYKRSVELLEKAIEGGINYIDTAYPYCHGRSEEVVGKVIKGIRKNLYISSKSPLWFIKKSSDFDRFLDESLDKLGIDMIDFYHFHSLNESFYEEKVLKLGLIDKALKAKEEGLIGHLSFSFHDIPESMIRFADTGIFDSVLCQYNFLDRSNEEAISHVREKGIGIAIMGPLAGGRIFDSAAAKDIEPDRLADLALRFVLSNEDVDMAISGMENTTVLEKNLKILNDFKPIDKEERSILDKIFSQKKIKNMIPCNNCGYCIPCPEDVAIPEIFKVYNYYNLTDLLGNSRFQYKKIPMVLGANTAEACTECGKCSQKCPQEIDIPERLKQIHKLFSD